MKELGLFAGIGGFSLGLGWAGIETVALCEIDKKCQLVLKKHWPDVRIYSDIKQLTYEKLKGDGIETIDIISGGFPCQPFSSAGKQRGSEDDRHLWPEMFRIIEEIRPTWVIGENVIGIVTMELDKALSDLEGIGYSTTPLDIPACAVDAKHQRRRIWITAHSKGKRSQRRRDLQISQEAGGNKEKRKPYRSSLITRISGIRKSWAPKPRICRVAHGIPNRIHRLNQLGNAVVPQIPYLIGKAIMEVENNEK
jgi:DNA (cytosine-5)-methyltransferase 1